MGEPLESVYFEWLCAKVVDLPIHVYYDFLRILYRTEFVWIIHGDKNRRDDGLELRQYFINESGFEREMVWFNEPCSLLELLIAFADRASFQTDIPKRDWFWRFMTNLNLDCYRQLSNGDQSVIEDILYTFVWRTYDECGNGNIIPVRHPKKNQKEVELWYQLCEYLEEQGLT